MENNFELICIESAEWIKEEARKLIKQHQMCKTEHERLKLFPKIEYMIKKLKFESNELEKIMYGN